MKNWDKMDIGVWRFGIISPILHRNELDEPLENALLRLADQSFRQPDGKTVSFSPETLKKWLYRYRKGGLPALDNSERKNKGTHTSIPKKIEDRLFELREKHPRWVLSRMLEQLIQEKLWDTKTPSRASLYRFAQTANLQRDPHITPLPAKAFEYEVFGQLWMADFLHGPKVIIQGKKRKTYLHAIIDDASRFVVHAGFYTSEDTEIMMMSLMEAIRRHGKPIRFYTDNGACYASTHLKTVCARLGIHLIHTPPGKPRGRGKVERFFRTVRDGFLDGDTPPANTLEGLNQAFSAWLGNYNRQPHGSLKTSPLNKKLSSASACTLIPETIEIESLFRMSRQCRVYLNNTIRLKKRSYDVPKALPGTRVEVWFMPWDLETVWYGPDMTPAKKVDAALNALSTRR
ncbi:DDE-type integrase/transposase/recombinase [Desulfobotulus mexicanus]|uniref:Transposase n=1 Tax=Desulfobotulus mexicanus TaxID=2586642 RepID=A0A5S5MEW7_9BACT|nr:DDE-type integrase/transposase/recombinase [Desulfobotulus mexicanus]TYT74262.1 transposase [Desulfobotulus mexicanus]